MASDIENPRHKQVVKQKQPERQQKKESQSKPPSDEFNFEIDNYGFYLHKNEYKFFAWPCLPQLSESDQSRDIILCYSNSLKGLIEMLPGEKKSRKM